ncbi:MAG: hypothetical protein PHS79_02865 [Patescibacteria group bacterium]|nr:hypothetical protein [Patescibacteria group bacterium]
MFHDSSPSCFPIGSNRSTLRLGEPLVHFKEKIMKNLFLVLMFVLLGCGSQAYGQYKGLADSDIVCEKCTPDQLTEESEGIRKAARALVDYTGSDLMPDYSPVTIHVSQDGACSSGASPYADYGYICLYSYEKHALPCSDCAPVTELPSQVMMVHEGLHEWFKGRVEFNYNLEEGFCKFVSVDVTKILEFINSQGHDIDTSPCIHSESESTKLVQGLCSLGLTPDNVREILRNTDENVKIKGAPLTIKEFSELVTGVMRRDATPAFRDANLL